jgi:hypothetical protein
MAFSTVFACRRPAIPQTKKLNMKNYSLFKKMSQATQNLYTTALRHRKSIRAEVKSGGSAAAQMHIRFYAVSVASIKSSAASSIVKTCFDFL